MEAPQCRYCGREGELSEDGMCAACAAWEAADAQAYAPHIAAWVEEMEMDVHLCRACGRAVAPLGAGLCADCAASWTDDTATYAPHIAAWVEEMRGAIARRVIVEEEEEL